MSDAPLNTSVIGQAQESPALQRYDLHVGLKNGSGFQIVTDWTPEQVDDAIGNPDGSVAVIDTVTDDGRPGTFRLVVSEMVGYIQTPVPKVIVVQPGARPTGRRSS